MNSLISMNKTRRSLIRDLKQFAGIVVILSVCTLMGLASMLPFL